MRLKTLRTAVVLVLLGLGSAELAAWLFCQLNQDRFLDADLASVVPTQESIDLERVVFDPVLGWKRRFPTSLGQRPQARLYDRACLATYGDSFTYGDEVLGFETWQTHLAGLLGAGVLNFGNGAYGPDQAYLRFLQDQPAAGTPVAVLSLIGENIARVVNVYRQFYLPQEGNALTKPRFHLENGTLVLEPNPTPTQASRQRLREVEFLKEIGQRDYWYVRRSRQAAAFPYSSLFFNINRLQELLNNVQWMQLWDEPELRALLLALLDAFAREARAMGAEPVVAVLPMEFDLLELTARGRPPGYVEQVLAHCRQTGLACFDAVSAMGRTLQGQGGQGGRGAAGVRELFLATHYSPLGNERLALAWYEYLGQAFPQIVPQSFDELSGAQAALASPAVAASDEVILPRTRGLAPLRQEGAVYVPTAANATALASWMVRLGEAVPVPPGPLAFAEAYLRTPGQSAAGLAESLLLSPELQAQPTLTDEVFVIVAARTLWGMSPSDAEIARLRGRLSDPERPVTRGDVFYELLWDARFRDHCARYGVQPY